MLRALEFDAVANGVPYISTQRRRIAAPDTRSRMVGYLATAPVASPGYRTDGEWVWPESLAEHARRHGTAPQEQLFEHMRRRFFLLPESLPDRVMDEAARAVSAPAVPDPAPPWDWIHLGGYLEPTAPADTLLRIRLREDGSVAEYRYEPSGWEPSHALQDQQVRPRQDRRQYLELTEPEAAAVHTALCSAAHRALLARDLESEPGDSLRLARVFDGEAPDGTPWFSPSRVRIPEPQRRERLAAYLTAGRLVVRVSGGMSDPLDPSGGVQVPLGFRTDGVWVWQESLAHYVRTRGAAPELEFLCHIERLGYRPPKPVSAELVPRAGAVVKAGAPPRLAKAPFTYFLQPSGSLGRSVGRDLGASDTFRPDLRWGRASGEARGRLDSSGYREISEEAAVRFVDGRWAAGGAVPPLD